MEFKAFKNTYEFERYIGQIDVEFNFIAVYRHSKAGVRKWIVAIPNEPLSIAKFLEERDAILFAEALSNRIKNEH